MALISKEGPVATGGYRSEPSPDEKAKEALRIAAAALAQRELSSAEEKRLQEEFKKASGVPYQRALKSLSNVLGLRPSEIVEKAAAFDNADRAMRELEEILGRLK